MELQLVLATLETGAFYGLVALAYFLFMRATNVTNFAIGACVAAAGLGAAWLESEQDVPMALAILAALALAAALSWFAERAVLRPIMARSSEEFAAVVAIVALMFVIEQAAALLFGRRPLRGAPLADGVILLGQGWIDWADIITLLATLAIFAAIAAWLRRGRGGRMLRAIGDNPEAARLLGLPVARVRRHAVLLAGLVAAVAGIFVGAAAPLDFTADLHFAIAGFIALVLGGMAWSWAPLVGGMLLAAIEGISARFTGGAAHDYVLLALVLVVFTLRPEGLFAVRVRH